MKCRACGQLNAKHKLVCRHCGASLKPEKDAGSDNATLPPLHSAQAKQEIPAWRKEVSEKARAYGERKRSLTTPPGPIKQTEERQEHPIPSKTEPSAAPVTEPEILSEPVVDVSALDLEHDSLIEAQPIRSSPTLSAPRPVTRSVIRTAEPPLELPAQEIARFPETVEQHNDLMFRRAVSFLIDNITIIVLYLLFRFVWSALAKLAPLPGPPGTPFSTLLAFGVLHALYYFYFYKTSRQTPGQVFFSLELRDRSMSRHIPAGRVFVRWLSMVILNVFNLLPLLKNNSELLLDRLSGTTLRLLKP